MIFILVFFVAHWYLSLFMQTFFQHRYAAHRAFTMSKFWENFFYIATYITQGSSYISPRIYAIMHRMHHAYTDTEKDPHSPANDRNVFAMMWQVRRVVMDLSADKMEIEPRFLKNLPEWRWLDKFGQSRLSRLLWIAIYGTIYAFFAPSIWWCFLIPFHVTMVPVQGVIINWFAHKYGSVNFKMKNTSTNLFKIDLLMMGEAYHNNHHKNPSATNFGFRWHEFDPTYQVIRVFKWMKIIRVPKLERTALPVKQFMGMKSTDIN